MCTAITIRTSQGNTCFGRTMDFSYPLDPELYISPRGYEKFWVKGIGKVHGTAKTGIALGSPYGDCGTHLHPSLFG